MFRNYPILPVGMSNMSGMPGIAGVLGTNVPPILPDIKFYNPITLRQEGSYNAYDNMYITSNVTSCGLNVTVSGPKRDVEKAICILNGATSGSADQTKPQTQTGQIFSPADKPITGATSVSSVSTGTISSSPSSWYQTINPRNRSKILLNNSTQPKPFSGSGIIFFENNSTDGKKTIILAQTSRGLYEDFGGEIDSTLAINDGTLKENARKEASEESQTLFWIKPNSFNLDRAYIDVPDIVNDAMYRCFFVALTGTERHDLKDLFDKNRTVLVNNLRLGKDFEETIGITRIAEDSLLNGLRSPAGMIVCADVKGNSCVIRDRTVNCLRMLFDTSNKTMYNTVFSAGNIVTATSTIAASPTFGSGGLARFEM